MKRLDVLFIIPGGHRKVFQELAEDFSAIEPPAWAGLLANYLRNRGCEVKIIDAPAEGLSPEQVAEQVVEFSPLLTVIMVYGHQPSASTQNMPASREVSQLIKEKRPDLKLMMLGTHPSALPERTLREEPIDFVCEGEGPITIYETLLALRSGEKDFKRVSGLWHWFGKPLAPTGNLLAPLIQDLDNELPGIAWDLLPMEKYRAHNWHCFEDIEHRKPYAALYTSLGCPFSCTFCCINAPFGKSSYRMFSPKWVIQEIDILVNKYGVRNIKFIDEMFVLNEAHVLGICDLIIERGYDLNIWAYARVDTIKEKFLKKLKKAGFRWLCLGIESGSRHVRDGAKKKFSNEDIIEAVRKIQAAGIYVLGNYMFGLPDDNLTTMQETLDLALEINAEWANFYCAMAYPGSALYQIAKEKGWTLPPGWIGYSQHAYETLPLPTENLPAREVLQFRDNTFQTYFTNPLYLEMIRRKFGEKAVEHIKKMTAIRLRRKLLE